MDCYLNLSKIWSICFRLSEGRPAETASKKETTLWGFVDLNIIVEWNHSRKLPQKNHVLWIELTGLKKGKLTMWRPVKCPSALHAADWSCLPHQFYIHMNPTVMHAFMWIINPSQREWTSEPTHMVRFVWASKLQKTSEINKNVFNVNISIVLSEFGGNYHVPSLKSIWTLCASGRVKMADECA